MTETAQVERHREHFCNKGFYPQHANKACLSVNFKERMRYYRARGSKHRPIKHLELTVEIMSVTAIIQSTSLRGLYFVMIWIWQGFAHYLQVMMGRSPWFSLGPCWTVHMLHACCSNFTGQLLLLFSAVTVEVLLPFNFSVLFKMPVEFICLTNRSFSSLLLNGLKCSICVVWFNVVFVWTYWMSVHPGRGIFVVAKVFV